MIRNQALLLSHAFLSVSGTNWSVENAHRIPRSGALLVVSNHRSFMDVPLLMAAIDRPIHFACHRYMQQVPLLQNLIDVLECLPLNDSQHQQQSFFAAAMARFEEQRVVGIFPEGAQGMLQWTPPRHLGRLQRGFAHLAWQATLPELTLIPIAIGVHREVTTHLFPLNWLSVFDPTEPLFQRSGWHPLILYRQVSVRVGQPLQINATWRQQYGSASPRQAIRRLINHCQQEIQALL